MDARTFSLLGLFGQAADVAIKARLPTDNLLKIQSSAQSQFAMANAAQPPLGSNRDVRRRPDQKGKRMKSTTDEDSQLRLVKLQIISGPEGVLAVAEASKQIGFQIRRMYFLTDLKRGARPPRHAHRTLQQCFICLRGSVTLDVEKRGRRQSIRLSEYSTALVLPAGYWRDLHSFTDDALLAVLASEEYDEGDYIRDYDDFRNWEARSKPQSVPYLDLQRYSAAMTNEFDAAISSVLKSGRFIGDPAVAQFESEFSAYCGSSHAVGVGNGLQALVLALRARAIGAGHAAIPRCVERAAARPCGPLSVRQYSICCQLGECATGVRG
jgi:hypothetical protein